MKLIISIACVAFGIWLAFTYPEIATLVLSYALAAWDFIWSFVGPMIKPFFESI